MTRRVASKPGPPDPGAPDPGAPVPDPAATPLVRARAAVGVALREFLPGGLVWLVLLFTLITSVGAGLKLLAEDGGAGLEAIWRRISGTAPRALAGFSLLLVMGWLTVLGLGRVIAWVSRRRDRGSKRPVDDR